MKGAFYGRHSTDRQTMETQRSMANDFAIKYGCTISCEYEDAGVSARKKKLDKRDGVSLLLKDAIDGRFDFVVINNHDRIARNPMEHQKIRMTLSGCKIPVVISNSESLYDSGDFIVDLIKDGTSKLEVDNIRTRTRDTIRTIARSGKWTGGKAPYGYRYDKVTKTFVQCEPELTIVRRIYELYRNNEGFQSVANFISRENGKPFNKTAVRWILTNPFYAGYISHHRKTANARNSLTPFDSWMMVKSDLINPIMSLDKWKETWLIYEQRKTGELTPKMYKTSFFLSNLLHCSVCNSLLICKDQTTYDKKRNIHYGKKWYCCLTCEYRIESKKIHSVIDAILNDLKSQNFEKVSSLVFEELLKERQLISEQLKLVVTQINSAEYQLQLADSKSKQMAQLVNDLETNDDNTKMVHILMLQKQLLASSIIELQKKLKQLKKTAQYLEQVEGNESTITRNIKSISVMSSHDNDHEIRKMITYLVQHAVFTPISKNSKNEVTNGTIDVHTRSNLIRTTIC